jgi:hypothetical protein
VVDDSCVAQWIEDYADAWRSGDAEAVDGWGTQWT